MSATRSSSSPEDGGHAPAEPPCRAELLAAWQKAYRRPPPKRSSTRLLALSHAYHRQVAVHGGLSPASKQKLAAWAAGNPRPFHRSAPTATRGPAEGTRLIRVWRGETHIVDVVADGVLYRATTYQSFSEVPRVITGARWSGPRFFAV